MGTSDLADETSAGFKAGWRHAQRNWNPLFVQTAGGIAADPDAFEGDEAAADEWSEEGRRQYIAGYNAYVVDALVEPSERRTEPELLHAEYASEQDRDDRNDTWGAA